MRDGREQWHERRLESGKWFAKNTHSGMCVLIGTVSERLDARCMMLDARCSMRDARCSMLDAGLRHCTLLCLTLLWSGTEVRCLTFPWRAEAIGWRGLVRE
jgi:hypothetical protein